VAAVVGTAAPAAGAPGCGGDPSSHVEGCGGATGDGTSYNTVVAIPGLSGGPGGSGGGGSSGGGCAGCDWYVTPACPINGPPPNAADVMCSGAAMACPQGGIRMRVFVRRPGESWTVAGTYCTGNGNGVVTVADVAADAGALYRDRMTPGAATIGVTPPPDRVLVNALTYFGANGAEPMRGTFGPDALTVTIAAVPTYVWDFGDGTTLETTSPGGPAGDVTHTYRAPGATTVRLTTRWHAEFTVTSALGTFGPYDVGGTPVAPSSTRAVDVHEARAELVGG
jgi:hypothetical protein